MAGYLHKAVEYRGEVYFIKTVGVYKDQVHFTLSNYLRAEHATSAKPLCRWERVPREAVTFCEEEGA